MKNIDVGFVNFKTPKLTKICLKFLKKNVLDEVNKIFVVDNNSNDKSLQLLKKTKFIDLIERK
ncbi:MAG: glycosyltransferase family 2 protein, partial [Methylophilaceae bacterium]